MPSHQAGGGPAVEGRRLVCTGRGGCWEDDNSVNTEITVNNGTKQVLQTCTQPVVVKKKCVKFAIEENQTLPVECRDEIEPEVASAMWYNPEEYAGIKARNKLTLAKMQLAGEELGDEHEPRGLEARTQEGAMERYENKRNSLNAVMDEQDRQWEAEQENDDEQIARVYLMHSTKSSQVASERGLSDAKAALEIMNEFRLSLQQPAE